MSVEAEFLDLMPCTVRVSEVASRDRHGKETAGSATPYRARVVGLDVNRRNKDGDNVAERPRAWILEPCAIGVDDIVEVVLADGTAIPGVPVLAVERYPDGEGAHHVKVTFGLVLGRG